VTDIRIEPWTTQDRPLLDRLLGDPSMTTHIGGPESPDKLASRQKRYEQSDSKQYRIVDSGGAPVGYVGYWPRSWQGEEVWEVGWAVLPEFQGRGYATAAMRLLLEVIRDDEPRPVHAFPSVDNVASNAVCRKLGFEPTGAHDFEYPPGNWLRCNDWRLASAAVAELAGDVAQDHYGRG
jgi:RimJ/RimL family protein N-acetyltransferase